jgi:excinuclease UvrABC nuclease subunit
MAKTTLYKWFDKKNKLVYVGIAFNAYTRMQEHSRTEGNEWVADAVKMEMTHFEHRWQALQIERLTIEKYRPKYNKVHNTGKVKPFEKTYRYFIEEAQRSLDVSTEDAVAMVRKLIEGIAAAEKAWDDERYQELLEKKALKTHG